MHTGAEITEVLKNAEELIEGFTTKLKVKYDVEDLEGLMATAQTRTDEEGNVEKEQVFRKFILSHLYYYLFYRVIVNEERF